MSKYNKFLPPMPEPIEVKDFREDNLRNWWIMFNMIALALFLWGIQQHYAHYHPLAEWWWPCTVLGL